MSLQVLLPVSKANVAIRQSVRNERLGVHLLLLGRHCSLDLHPVRTLHGHLSDLAPSHTRGLHFRGMACMGWSSEGTAPEHDTQSQHELLRLPAS